MSLVKVPFLFGGVIAGYVFSTPPQPRVPAHQRPKNVSVVERLFSSIVQTYSSFLKVSICAGGIAEIAVIFANQVPSHPLAQKILETLILGPTWRARRAVITPAFLVGAMLAYSGGYIRYKCYQTLGRLFTFELAIRDNHRLVTEGPYSYVRHPGYLGAIACAAGLGIMAFAPGSWARECGIMDSHVGRFLPWTYSVLFSYGVISVFMRTPQEDALLKREFGEEWEAYARTVRYRIVPFVF